MPSAGKPWAEPAGDEPALRVAGIDAELALAAQRNPGRVIEFVPDDGSDIARTLGLTPGSAPKGERVVALDGMLCITTANTGPLVSGRSRARGAQPSEILAVDTVVVGTPPDRLTRASRRARMQVAIDGRTVFAGRATTVVVASGEFLRGVDLVPRGHPGDGRLEVQIYTLERRERRPMRARLATGTHVPHPQIREQSGRHVEVTTDAAAFPFEADGVERASASSVSVVVLPGAVRLRL